MNDTDSLMEKMVDFLRSNFIGATAKTHLRCQIWAAARLSAPGKTLVPPTIHLVSKPALKLLR